MRGNNNPDYSRKTNPLGQSCWSGQILVYSDQDGNRFACFHTNKRHSIE
jgi:hypothetical protein